MSRKKRIPVYLHDTKKLKLEKQDIEAILRAADDIIFASGRSMLVKILKGSKDKKLLSYGLDSCPSYGYYNHLKISEIEPIVDWMIVHNYLAIEYSGKLPLIVFDTLGWETYQPVKAKELLAIIKESTSNEYEALADDFVTLNRDIIHALLYLIETDHVSEIIDFLNIWRMKAYKKDGKAIGHVIRKLTN